MKWLRLAWQAIYYPVRVIEFLAAFLIFWVLVGAIVSAAIFNYDFHNAVLHGIFWPLAKTQWSDEFSESKFDGVKPGMSRESVERLLGVPLNKQVDKSSGESYWIYSWSGLVKCCDAYEGNFHRREVRFASDGNVKSVSREFDPE